MEGKIRKIEGIYPVTVLDALYMGDGTGATLAEHIDAAGRDYDRHVKGVAHRGYSSAAPENTLAAYRLAAKMGFRYVETDVAFTSDGVAVLLHDSTIDRTSNGSGAVNALTLSELRSYDFGSWKDAAYAGEKIPTLEEFVLLCRNLGLHPYIELKESESYTAAQLQSCVDTVRSCGMLRQVTWISFSAAYLRAVRGVDAKARLGLLSWGTNYDNDMVSDVTTALSLRNGSNEVFLDSHFYMSQAAVEACAANELPLEAWTVDDAGDITGYLRSYVSGVTSNSLHAGKVLYEWEAKK